MLFNAYLLLEPLLRWLDSPKMEKKVYFVTLNFIVSLAIVLQ